jgi:hypothetical protein
MQSMKARAITRRKELRDDGSIVEIAIWELPEPLLPCTHCYKYRLAYVANGVCVVRYDNERGKGDHRHVGDDEMPYRFVDLDRLFADFRLDMENWK